MPDLSFNVIDNLTYTYGDAARPDRLTNVSDAGNAAKGFKFTSGAAAYTYDLNGNLTQDNHKGLSFQYNYLNLPNYYSNTGGADVSLTYTADGEKLTKVSSAGTRNYISGIEYLGSGLDAIYHAEGRCTPNTATTFYYEYTLKDHLGNARINFRANGAAVTFLQELHYYPFGMVMEGIGTAKVTDNGYKYNGKELNEDLGLNLSDYGARWYDAALGRWWSVDPMGEKTINISPYAYVHNNPILLIDPNGMLAGNPFEVMADRKEKMDARTKETKRQIDEEQGAKNAPNDLPKAFYVNEAGLSNQSLINIALEAATILSNNGYAGLSLNQVSSKEAKRHNVTYPNQMFLALIRAKNNNLDPGCSNINPTIGLVGVYNDGNKDGLTQGWASYVNMNDEAISKHSNQNYAAGYVVAHELTHQLIGIAAFYSGDKGTNIDHANGFTNLLNSGRYTHIPAGPVKDALQNAEMIPPAARKSLDRFYLTPSKRLR